MILPRFTILLLLSKNLRNTNLIYTLAFVVSGLLIIFNIDSYLYNVYAQNTNITIETIN
jgi:hypothetical protein